MAEDLIRYDILAQDALRGMVRKVLSEVARTGLPGAHHFFIKIATRAPGVRVSSRLLRDYPEEMTIVLQHQYWDLTVTEQAFEVGLSFDGTPERLLVPFTAVRGFVDPSVPFGLTFETAASAATREAGASAADGTAAVPAPLPPRAVEEKPRLALAAEKKEGEEPEEARNAEVVSLDAFRKKS
jgi:uncharacterized protein